MENIEEIFSKTGDMLFPIGLMDKLPPFLVRMGIVYIPVIKGDPIAVGHINEEDGIVFGKAHYYISPAGYYE